RLASGTTTVPLQVDSAAFAGGFRPERDGGWQLELLVVGGAPLEGPPVEFAVRMVPDSAPTVEVPVPGRDTVAPPSLRVPLVVAMRDDHGVQSAYLELRQRGRETPVRQALDLPGGASDQALVSLGLDLTELELAPGDSVWVTAVALDNAPAPRIGRSRPFVIRVPTAAEVREERREQTGATAS